MIRGVRSTGEATNSARECSRAYLEYANGSPKRLAVMRKLVERHGFTPLHAVLLGNICENMGDVDFARDLYEEAYTHDAEPGVLSQTNPVMAIEHYGAEARLRAGQYLHRIEDPALRQHRMQELLTLSTTPDVRKGITFELFCAALVEYVDPSIITRHPLPPVRTIHGLRIDLCIESDRIKRSIPVQVSMKGFNHEERQVYADKRIVTIGMNDLAPRMNMSESIDSLLAAYAGQDDTRSRELGESLLSIVTHQSVAARQRA